MRFIITGGTGLIGRELTENLAVDGHEVIVLSRTPERAEGLPHGARAERWDGRTASGWGPLADGVDAIVNLAGENIAEGRWTEDRKKRIRESRIHAGQAVVQAVEKATFQAKRNLIEVPIVENTIPHEVEAKFGPAQILLRPQRKGRGLVAGGTVRIICELCGIHDISSKFLSRTKNKLNIAKATIKALKKLKLEEKESVPLTDKQDSPKKQEPEQKEEKEE